MTGRILIVDDSALARRTLRLFLEGMGHAVEEAVDGAQALERAASEPPDLIILDMVMRGMYGLEVLGRMREVNPDVRVLIATADVQNSTADQARAAGAKGILHKPVTRDALNAAVGAVLQGGDAWN